MAHAQKPDFVFRRNVRVHLNRRRSQFIRHLAAEVCASAFIVDSNTGYTMFRCSEKSTGYPLHQPVSPSLPLPLVTVCHHISTGVYNLCSRPRACCLSVSTLTVSTLQFSLALTTNLSVFIRLCCSDFKISWLGGWARVASTTVSLLIKARNVSVIYMETLCLQHVSAEMGHRQAIHNIQIRCENCCTVLCLHLMTSHFTDTHIIQQSSLACIQISVILLSEMGIN